MTEKNAKQMVFLFLFVTGFILMTSALAVFLIDPFFHYHKPWFGLAAYQNEKEHQIPGVLDHLDYGSVLLGSSVVMSVDTGVLEARYASGTVKAVANTAPASVLAEYLRRAYKSHDLDYVFYGMDVFSFYSRPGKGTASDVEKLENDNPFDDVWYLWNGQILAEKIPNMLRVSREEYTWGKAYSFNEGEPVGPDQVLARYEPVGLVEVAQEPWENASGMVMENLNALEAIVEAHPETEFIFFLPPYPVVWWDQAYNRGLLESYEQTLRVCIEGLLKYENAKVYATRFNEEALITDMYRYMDDIHGSAAVTDQLAWDIGDPAMEITAENYEDQIAQLDEILWRFKARVDAEGVGFLYEVKTG